LSIFASFNATIFNPLCSNLFITSPPIAKRKRKSKNTKKNVFIYTCTVCKKAHQSKKGKRAGKVIFE